VHCKRKKGKREKEEKKRKKREEGVDLNELFNSLLNIRKEALFSVVTL